MSISIQKIQKEEVSVGNILESTHKDGEESMKHTQGSYIPILALYSVKLQTYPPTLPSETTNIPRGVLRIYSLDPIQGSYIPLPSSGITPSCKSP